MHQSQFVKALCGTLDEALTLMAQHVTQHGGVDNWWTWEVARLPEGAVKVRERDEAELASWLEGSEGAQRQERLQMIRDRLDQEAAALMGRWQRQERWLREPWLGVLSELELAGMPWMTSSLGDKAGPEERETKARIRRMAPGRIPAWFLKEARDELARRYAEAALPPDGITDAMASVRRRILGAAFESVYEALAREDAEAAHLPYRRGCSPYEWPAHLIGADAQAGPIFLLVDMHR